MTIRNLSLIAVCLVGLVACETAEDMQLMFEQQKSVQAALKESIGVEPQVGWNIHNGRLTNVNVVFTEEDVASMTIADLSSRVSPAVIKGFGQLPEAIAISIMVDPGAK